MSVIQSGAREKPVTFGDYIRSNRLAAIREAFWATTSLRHPLMCVANEGKAVVCLFDSKNSLCCTLWSQVHDPREFTVHRILVAEYDHGEAFPLHSFDGVHLPMEVSESNKPLRFITSDYILLQVVSGEVGVSPHAYCWGKGGSTLDSVDTTEYRQAIWEIEYPGEVLPKHVPHRGPIYFKE